MPNPLPPLPDPFSWIDRFADEVESRFGPPEWLKEEVLRKILVVVNHVLLQEPQATERMMRMAGRKVDVRWRQQRVALKVTPAGLFDLYGEGAAADLSVTLTQSAPSELLKAAMAGDKPAVRIEGDVLLAAEINWLADHVRWDVEEDLSRVMGDGPAHTLMGLGRSVVDAARAMVARRPRRPSSTPEGPPPATQGTPGDAPA